MISSTSNAVDHKTLRRIPAGRIGRSASSTASEAEFNFANDSSESKEAREQVASAQEGTDVPYLCTCTSALGVFGVVRDDVLDLFSISAENNAAEPLIDHELRSIAPIVSRVGRVRLVDGHCKEPRKGNPRSPRTLHVYDVSMERRRAQLLISAVCASARSSLQPVVNEDMWLCVGHFELNSWSVRPGAATSENSKYQTVAMMRRVQLGLDFHKLIHRIKQETGKFIEQRGHYSYFSDRYIHAFTTSGIVLISLDRVLDKSALGEASGTTFTEEERSSRYPDHIDLASVTVGNLDFSTLCGNETVSAVPGDGRRPLAESAVVAISHIHLPKYRSDAGDEDALELVQEENLAMFLCRSHPSFLMLRASI